MRAAYVATIILALFLVSSCGPKVNNPADEEAIKTLNAGYDEAYNSRDLDWIRSNFWTDDAVALPPNAMPASGLEAIVAQDEEDFEIYSSSNLNGPAEEVQSSGDLAVARGTFYWTATPKESGLSNLTSEGKWIGTFNRQDDGSWKCSQLIWNSDRPAPGATADGADEEALLQIERDWLNAALNKDKDTLDRILADDFVSNTEQGVRNKRQAIARDMSTALKFESAEHSDLRPMVFGDTAVVYGVTTVKGTERGKDISGKYRWTDVFERRDGSWKCVIAYGTASTN
jgi:ketosteroid isomerase-like protein